MTLKPFALTAALLFVWLLPACNSITWGASPYAETYQAGRDYEKKREFPEARARFTAAWDHGETAAEKFNARIAIGRMYDAEGKYPEARSEYEKALAMEGITPEQAGQATFNIGASYVNGEHTYRPGFEALEKVIAMEGASTANQVEAHMMIADVMASYNHAWAWPRAVTAYNSILSMPDISPQQELAAQKGLVKALIGLKQHAEAHAVMTDMVSAAGLSEKERLATEILAAKISLLQGNFVAARSEAAKAMAVDAIPDGDKADIQLQLALSYYDAGDYERAKPELLKVLTMRGANAYRRQAAWDCGYRPANEARVRLRLQNLVPSDEPEVAVLFVGSSMISRGDMAPLVSTISASAPAGRPRVVFSVFARNGTGMKAFWDEGNRVPGTPQRVITGEPWDMVVMETFHTMTREDLLKYGGLFAELARSRKIRPVFYEAHPAQAAPYPDSTRKFHEDNVALKETQTAVLAPVALAEMYYVETVPTARREEFYDDWVHPSEKGRYMVAYCIYAAITGYSPVGLSHPKSISDEDAKAMQEAAWKAVQETNPNLKPWE